MRYLRSLFSLGRPFSEGTLRHHTDASAIFPVQMSRIVSRLVRCMALRAKSSLYVVRPARALIGRIRICNPAQMSERPCAPSTGMHTPVIQLARGDASIVTA